MEEWVEEEEGLEEERRLRAGAASWRGCGQGVELELQRQPPRHCLRSW